MTTPSTSDLYDTYGDQLQSCDVQMRQFGGTTHFSGEIATFRSEEDNLILKSILAEPGHGRVIVIDTRGSLRVAMLGDNMAAAAARNGWAGIIVNGSIRDVAALRTLPIGIKALGSNPRRSRKEGTGERDIPLTFGGVTFVPGQRLVSDEDGIVILPAGEVFLRYADGGG
ncbi:MULTISPECIES: ribonuclease E activity regulator RraA [Streptomyces violaceusniger group]|uniref:4-hydroxy-4-methyl-2-oxoglutarate aldolase n=1 Tax=Streptomyces javensis TaxID=114698 RepID=A0ABN1WEL9_9ACTN